MHDDYYYEWTHRVALEWRTVIAESEGKDGVARKDAQAIAAERLRVLVDSGDLKIPVDTAITAALLEADRRDTQQADKVIRKVLRGEDALTFDGDPGLEIVVALGDGVRKTLGATNLDDWLAMDGLKYRNMRSAADAVACRAGGNPAGDAHTTGTPHRTAGPDLTN